MVRKSPIHERVISTRFFDAVLTNPDTVNGLTVNAKIYERLPLLTAPGVSRPLSITARGLEFGIIILAGQNNYQLFTIISYYTSSCSF